MSARSICGVIIASSNPEGLSGFYEKILGLKFVREDHGGLLPHYGADIGEVHFGIHPAVNLNRSGVGNSATSIAFNVQSLENTLNVLAESGAVEVAAPHDEGFGRVASYLDPEGNLFEVVELCYEFQP